MNNASKEIEDLIFKLNEKIDEYNSKQHNWRDYEFITHFTYQTAGYYSFIKFGEEILWDSENEPREYNEDTNEYESLEMFVKKQFNKYVNTLKTFRFTDVIEIRNKIGEAYDAADEIVETIQKINILGHEWDILEDGAKDDTYEKIVGVVLKYN